MSLPLFQLPQSSIVYFNSLYLFSFPFSFSTLGVKETGWVSDLVLNYSTQLSYQDNFLSLCSSKSHKILQPSDYSISPVFVHTLCQLFQIPIFQSLQWVILATLHSFCPNLGYTDTLCATVSSFTSHNLHIWDTSSPDVLLYLLLVFNVLSCTSVIMFSVSFLRNCFFNSPMLHLLLPGKFLFRIACVKLYFITYFHVSFKFFLFLELFFYFSLIIKILRTQQFFFSWHEIFFKASFLHFHMNPQPHMHLLTSNLSMSALGWCGPYMLNIFLVFLSSDWRFCIVHSIIPAQYLITNCVPECMVSKKILTLYFLDINSFVCIFDFINFSKPKILKSFSLFYTVHSFSIWCQYSFSLYHISPLHL